MKGTIKNKVVTVTTSDNKKGIGKNILEAIKNANGKKDTTIQAKEV